MTTPLEHTKGGKAVWLALVGCAALLCMAIGVSRLAGTRYELANAKAELAIKASEEAAAKDQEMRAFINEFDYPIAMLDSRGEVVEWNDAAERDFGWTKEELQANGIASIMPDDMRDRHHSAFGKAMAGSGRVVGKVKSPVQRVECVVIHKDPSRKPIPVEVSVRVVREDDGDLYAIAHIDKQSRILRVDASEGVQ